jgi:hypothetical protein
MSVAENKNLLTAWPKLTEQEQEIVVFAVKHCSGPSVNLTFDESKAMFWCRKKAIAALRKLNEISTWGYGRKAPDIIRKIETSE